MKLYFWPLKTKSRIIGYPNASYQNNADHSSQRGQCVFIAEARLSGAAGKARISGAEHTRGSLVDYESTKIKRTTLSTTVAELYSFMKCYGTCQYLRGLWMDLSGEDAPIHMRTDANNLATTAQTTHLPEKKETIHMIQMLRKEACSGSTADLAHIATEYCLSDCLTKASAKADELIKAVTTGVLPQCDKHPPFREKLQHKAYTAAPDTTEVSRRPPERSLQQFPLARKADYWERTEGSLTRVHLNPGKALFTPNETCPAPMSQLSPNRITFLSNSAQKMQLRDSWITPAPGTLAPPFSTGYTRFFFE